MKTYDKSLLRNAFAMSKRGKMFLFCEQVLHWTTIAYIFGIITVTHFDPKFGLLFSLALGCVAAGGIAMVHSSEGEPNDFFVFFSYFVMRKYKPTQNEIDRYIALRKEILKKSIIRSSKDIQFKRERNRVYRAELEKLKSI